MFRLSIEQPNLGMCTWVNNIVLSLIRLLNLGALVQVTWSLHHTSGSKRRLDTTSGLGCIERVRIQVHWWGGDGRQTKGQWIRHGRRCRCFGRSVRRRRERPRLFQCRGCSSVAFNGIGGGHGGGGHGTDDSIRHGLQCGRGGHETGSWMMGNGLLLRGGGRGGHGTSHVWPWSRVFGRKIEHVFGLERRIRTGGTRVIMATGAFLLGTRSFLVGLGKCRLVHAILSNRSCLLHCVSAVTFHCHQSQRRQCRRHRMRNLDRGAMFRRDMAAAGHHWTVPTRGVLLPARRSGRRHRVRWDKAWNVVVQIQSAHGNVGGATTNAPTG
jgi:hypothetical protein